MAGPPQTRTPDPPYGEGNGEWRGLGFSKVSSGDPGLNAKPRLSGAPRSPELPLDTGNAQTLGRSLSANVS